LVVLFSLSGFWGCGVKTDPNPLYKKESLEEGEKTSDANGKQNSVREDERDRK